MVAEEAVDEALRWAEVIIFGATGAFFVVVQHLSIVHAASQGRYPPSPVAYWYALMFTYAIFIPMTWRRAAVILGVMAAAPIVGVLFDAYRFESVAEMTSFDTLSGIVLMMLIGYGRLRVRHAHDRHAAPRGLRGPATGPIPACGA